MTRARTLSQIFGATLLAGAVLAFVPAAHAENWFDRMFTFREDQKDRVKPPYVNKPLPPRYELGPYYDKQAGVRWSTYYTRQDLSAQPNMDGSSMVMRPDENKRAQLRAEAAQRRQQNMQNFPDPVWQVQQNGQPQARSQYYVQPHPNYVYGYGPANIPPGYTAMQWRDYMNRMMDQQNRQQIYIGEAGTGPDRNDYRTGDVGVKTQVGDPRMPWNYQQPQRIDYTSLARRQQQQGQIMIEDGDGTARVPQGGQLPNQYMVQQGDTLSTISGQEQIYGDWLMWPLIYDANQHQLTDPDLVYPQQNLGIPRDYTPQQANSARQRARSKVPPHRYDDRQ